MVDRRAQQREVFALLLAIASLVIPVSGAALYGRVAAPGSDSAFLFVGAASVQDFVPVLMLVGALAILVVSTGGRERSAVARATGWVVLLAGATLAAAYFGTAFHLRAGGTFDLDPDESGAGWTAVRLIVVASMAATGVLCGAVAAQAAMWMGERRTEHVR